MKKIFDPKRATWPEILKRPTQSYSDIEPIVKQIFDEVSVEGDTALKRYIKKFDKADLDSLSVSQIEIDHAKENVSEELKKAIALAKSNIEAFHASQVVQTA